MDRVEAIRFIATYPKGLIDVATARKISSACGVNFDVLSFYDTKTALVRMPGEARKGWYFKESGLGTALVLTAHLGAMICRYMDLYADNDHALASPHATKGKEAEYIGQRAAVRLARAWYGEDGVDDLKATLKIQQVLVDERVYKIS